MDFIPEQPKDAQQVPFFEEATADGGWQGHGTGKSIQQLQSEISSAIGRLGGMIVGFQRGHFVLDHQKREGFQVHYTIENPGGHLIRGKLDIAALPLKKATPAKQEKTLKMALFMLRNALDGAWFLQQLSPGYAALMPWMLDERTGKSVTQLWSESAFSHLLPAGEEEFVEGEYKVTE